MKVIANRGGENADINRYFFRYSWFQLLRPLTLTGTITPVLVGTGLALRQDIVRWDFFIAVMISALLIQATTNVLNDYFDFKHGQDKEKWVHPSEGQRARGPAHDVMPYIAGVCLTVATLLGLWLAFESSLWVAFVGILGIAASIGYSAGSYSFSSIGLGEAVAFVFLGPVITGLAYTVQGHSLNLSILFASLPFALLIASMVLTNNMRDLQKDKGFRNTLAFTLGWKVSRHLLIAMLIMAYFIVLLLIAYQVIPSLSFGVLFALPIALRATWLSRKEASQLEEMNSMKWIALHHWVFGLLYALGIWLSG